MKLVTQAMLGVISVAVISAAQLFSAAEAAAVPGADRLMVRIAEIEIDPLYLDAYKAILAEEQEASVRFEPGVLMLHSVAIADNPTHIRLLEVYAEDAVVEESSPPPYSPHQEHQLFTKVD